MFRYDHEYLETSRDVHELVETFKNVETEKKMSN